jgi:uncharacterized damage-inducible protein DinB
MAQGFQHLLDIYSSETAKTASTWRCFTDADLDYKPHPRSSSVRDILKHQILSERRFFAEFLGFPEPPAAQLLPEEDTIEAYGARYEDLARARLRGIAEAQGDWWQETTRFFDVERERIWIFWRRVLHTAHHRTQLTVYLRLLDRAVPSIYGPTADATWSGADPTTSIEAAERGAT